MRRSRALDVAKAAGVSRATVSRAFDANGVIDEMTRARVLAVASVLDYQPSALGRGLNRSQSDLVALIVNNLRNPFEAETHDLLVSSLIDLRLHPFIVPVHASAQASARLRTAAGYEVSAAITSSDCVGAEDVRQAFGRSTPCIMVNGRDGDRVDTLRSEIEGPVEELIAATVATHRAYAFLAGPGSSRQSRYRLDVVTAALERRSRRLDVVAEGDFTYDSGYSATLTMLRDRPEVDCIVAANDAMAMGAMDALRHVLGRAVPGDVSVAGFDGIHAGSWSSYGLTTITPTIPIFVEGILSLLAARRADPVAVPLKKTLEAKLIRRQSVRLS